jgi:hypothetical protein
MIICEGKCEQIFVEKVLVPYLYKHNESSNNYNPNLEIKNCLIGVQGHKGGNVGYDRIKCDINKVLKQDSNCYVTTFIDYYKLHNDFPQYDKSQTINNNLYGKIKLLEDAIQDDINSNRVIPYIQVHEYETFYFADVDNFICSDGVITESNQQILKQQFGEVNQ